MCIKGKLCIILIVLSCGCDHYLDFSLISTGLHFMSKSDTIDETHKTNDSKRGDKKNRTKKRLRGLEFRSSILPVNMLWCTWYFITAAEWSYLQTKQNNAWLQNIFFHYILYCWTHDKNRPWRLFCSSSRSRFGNK